MRLKRDAATLGVAVLGVGLSFGAATATAGLSVWTALALSTLVFAGAAQFAVVGVFAAGGSALAALGAALVVNLRLIPLSLVVGAVGRRRWSRLLSAHLLTEEVVAFERAAPDPEAAARAYWVSGAVMFATWNLGTCCGALLATAADPAALGLDAAYPAVLVALAYPAIVEGGGRVPAAVAATVAVTGSLFLPAGLPVLVGVLVAGPVILHRTLRAATNDAGTRR